MAEAPNQELDDDGLIVQKYRSQVLVVMPPEGFGDQTLRYARSSLYNVHVGTLSVAADPESEVKGRLQDAFLVDQGLEGQTMDDFCGILIVACDGPNPLADDARVLDLLRAADRDQKMIATWGNGAAALARAGVVRGRKLTGAAPCEEEAQRAGARWSGREVVVSGHVISARDEGAGMRFGQALADQVRIS
jgi:putative intracellular protease/amidase